MPEKKVQRKKVDKDKILKNLVGTNDSFFNDSANIETAYKIIANDVKGISTKGASSNVTLGLFPFSAIGASVIGAEEFSIEQAIEELRTNTGKRNQTKIVGKLLSKDSITHDNAVTELKLMVQIRQKEEARRRSEKTPEIEHLERMNAILDCATREQALEIAVTPEELHYVDEMFGVSDDGDYISK